MAPLEADSIDGRDTSVMEVSCDERSQTAEGDVAYTGQASLSRTATWLAARPTTAVLDRDCPGQVERGRSDRGEGGIRGWHRRGQPLTAAEIDRATRLYKSGQSLTKIGSQFECDPATVRRALFAVGVLIRRRTISYVYPLFFN